jgi:hypothetical protein
MAYVKVLQNLLFGHKDEWETVILFQMLCGRTHTVGMGKSLRVALFAKIRGLVTMD